MDGKQNNMIATLGLYDKTDDGEKNNMKSDVLPPNNPPAIWKNRVDIEGEFQGVVQLTPAQLEFLAMVADAIQPASAIPGKLNIAPAIEDDKTDFRHLSSENEPGLQQSSMAMQTESFTPKIKPVLQLVAKRLDKHTRLAKPVFSDVLTKALRPAAIRRSLDIAMPMHFPWRINIDVIEEKSLGNITIPEDSTTDSRQLSIESVSADLQQPVMQTEIVTPKIKPVLPVIFPCPINVDVIKKNVDCARPASERVRFRPILLALRRRLLTVGRWLCCWSRVPSSSIRQ